MATQNELVFEGFDIEQWDIQGEPKGEEEQQSPSPALEEDPDPDTPPDISDNETDGDNDGKEQLELLSDPDDSDDQDDDTSDKARQEVVENHFKYAKEQNLLYLPEDFEFDGNIEQAYLVDAQHRQQLVADNLVNQMPDELKAIVQYGLAASRDGLSVDYTDLIETSSSVEYLKGLDFQANQQSAEEFLLDYYTEEVGIKKSAAMGALERHKDEGDLVETAAQFRDQMVASYEDDLKDRTQDTEKKIKNEQQKQIQHYQTVNKLINEAQWASNTKRAIKHELYNGVTASKIDNLLTKDPKGLVQLLQFLSQYDLEKGFLQNQTDKKIKTQAAQKVKDDFFSKLATPKKQGSGPSKKKRKNLDLTQIEQIQF